MQFEEEECALVKNILTIQVMQVGLLTLLLPSVILCAPQALIYCEWRETLGAASSPSFPISWQLQYVIPALSYRNSYVPVQTLFLFLPWQSQLCDLLLYLTYKSQIQMLTFLQRMHCDFHRLRLGWCIEIKVFPRCLLNSGDIPTAFASWKSWPCVVFSSLWRLSIKGQVHECLLWYVWQSISKYY